MAKLYCSNNDEINKVIQLWNTHVACYPEIQMQSASAAYTKIQLN